jgi:hypothetical protein
VELRCGKMVPKALDGNLSYNEKNNLRSVENAVQERGYLT